MFTHCMLYTVDITLSPLQHGSIVNIHTKETYTQLNNPTYGIHIVIVLNIYLLFMFAVLDNIENLNLRII